MELIKKEYTVVKHGATKYRVMETLYVFGVSIVAGYVDEILRNRQYAYMFISNLREKETENRKERNVYITLSVIIILTLILRYVV